MYREVPQPVEEQRKHQDHYAGLQKEDQDALYAHGGAARPRKGTVPLSEEEKAYLVSHVRVFQPTSHDTPAAAILKEAIKDGKTCFFMETILAEVPSHCHSLVTSPMEV